MYDFLLSEVWWMEALLGALATVVLGYLAYKTKIDKIVENIVESVKLLQEAKLTQRGLEKDHSSLEKDHGYISDQLTGIATTATALREDSIRTQEQRKILSGKELDIKTTVEQLTGLIDIVAELRAENRELKMANLEQRKEIQELKEHINQMDEQQDKDYDLEP